MTKIATLTQARHGDYFSAKVLRDSDATTLDPFLGIDHALMGAPTFPAHPHAGFSAVSYVFQDSQSAILNRDSLGTQNLIQPGGLHWTAAGSGVVHEENPAEAGKTVHMLQIFINLPVSKQADAPFMLSIAAQDVPEKVISGGRVRVPLGQTLGMQSPLQTPTKVGLFDIALDENSKLDLPVLAADKLIVMPVAGSVRIDGAVFHSDQFTLPIYPEHHGKTSLTIEAVDGPAQVVVFSGQPLKQPVFWHGPIAMASQNAVTQALNSYRKGEFGIMS